jgi:hypothetical protein
MGESSINPRTRIEGAVNSKGLVFECNVDETIKTFQEAGLLRRPAPNI